jgi:hypothetical protein
MSFLTSIFRRSLHVAHGFKSTPKKQLFLWKGTHVGGGVEARHVPCIPCCTMYHASYAPRAFTMYHVPCTMCIHHVPCIMCIHHVPCTMYHVHSPCTMYHVPCIMCHVPCIMYHVSCTMYHIPCIMYHAYVCTEKSQHCENSYPLTKEAKKRTTGGQGIPTDFLQRKEEKQTETHD